MDVKPLLHGCLLGVLAVTACVQPVFMPLLASSTSRTTEFEGHWEYRSGQVARTCQVGDAGTADQSLDETSATLELVAGINGELELVEETCRFTLDSVGGTAWMREDQNCRSLANGLGRLRAVDGQLVLDSNGRRMTQQDMVFQVKVEDASGRVLSDCKETWNGELRKTSNASTGSPSSTSSGGAGACSDTCNFAGDGTCDDGGPASSFSLCDLGTDCTDCGPR